MATNYALASNGSTATASSSLGGGAGPAAAIDGDKSSVAWWDSNGGIPATLTVDFGQSRTITEIDLISVRDNYTAAGDPTLSETGSTYLIADFTVDYWNGSSWVNIATVTGNNKVWRQFTFSAVAATKIRVVATAVGSSSARIKEIEAWGNPPDATPPSTVTNLTATKISNAQINLDSDAAADNVGIAGYQTQVSQDGGASWTTLASSTKAFSFVSGNTGFPGTEGGFDLIFRRKAYDAAGNYSAAWNTTAAPVNIVVFGPVVSISAPVNNANVAGTIAVTATVANFPGLIGVQFKIDDADIGTEDTSAPYAANLVSPNYRNGDHTLRAIARSAAVTKETAIQISIFNSFSIGNIFVWDAVRRPAQYIASSPDWKAVTASHEMEDGGMNFNELNTSKAPRTWKLVYTGLKPSEDQIFEAHWNLKRVANPFSFVAKTGATFAGVRYQSSESSDADAQTGTVTRTIVLIQYPE